jgi:hypothetical protein
VADGPRSSLPATVLAWLATPPRPADPTPPARPRRYPPLALRSAWTPSGPSSRRLSDRHAGRMVAISKTQVGDSLDLLLGALAALGYCQPDGTFVGRPPGLRERLVEMAATGEAVVVDGWPREERPRGWTSQQVLYGLRLLHWRRQVGGAPTARPPGRPAWWPTAA